MLYISLALSVVLLVVSNVLVRRRYAAPAVIGTGVAFVFIPAFCLMLASPVVFFQAVCLVLLLVVLLIPERGRKLYLPLSCIASIGVYAWFVIPEWQKRTEMHVEHARFRDENPLESIEDRIPIRRGWPAPDQTKQTEFEQRLEGEISSNNSRQAALHRLHSAVVDNFANSPGFGVSRGMHFQYTPGSGLDKVNPDTPVPQPDYLVPYFHPEGKLAEPQDWRNDRMESLHLAGSLDFVNPGGFGYFKSRREVAGFRSHGMSKVPDSNDAWKPARIELVGLLLHESPVVYRSTNLPRMTELKSVPTRPLDDFEVEGMAALKNGDDLFVRGAGDKARMIGSIRATKQCLQCHEGNRGDLLGAFSYGFRRESK